MTPEHTTTDRLRAVLVVVATAATIAFNGMAAAGLVNDVTPAEISDKYPTVLTPAGYAFSIWSAIYLGLIAFSIHQLLPRNLARYSTIRLGYIVCCALNVAWIYFWHRDQILICLVLIIALSINLGMIVARLRAEAAFRNALLTKVPFGIYFGWVTCASIVNLAIFLVYWGVEWSTSAWAAFGAAALIGASLLAVIVRWKFSNFLYPIAVAWALTAIAVKQSGNTPIVVAAAIGVVISLVTAGSIVMRLGDPTSAER